MFSWMLTAKFAVVAITLAGMAFCSVGIGQVAARGDWLHPLSIVAYIVGFAILVIAGTTLFDVKLPLISTTQAALTVIVAFMALKVLLTQLHRLMA